MYMSMRKINNLQRDQSGFASIVIALVLIIVLALLTVGFAELARREQQSALDKQLASQAYYAAESGVNDMSQAILNAFNVPGAKPDVNSLSPTSATGPGKLDPNQCLESQTGTDPQLANLPDNRIDPTHGVSYSCVLLNLQPPALVKTPLSANTAWTTTFATDGGGILDSFTVNWGSLSGKLARGGSSGVFTPVGTWNAAAVLQVSITPLKDLSRQGLIDNTFTTYLYPQCSGGNTATYHSQLVSQQVPIVNGNGTKCSTGSYSVTINGLKVPTSNTGEFYAINILDYYDDSGVSISDARAFGSGKQLDFTNAQATIDVTGQAKNVLKRIQVHMPLKQPGTIPTETVEAQNICKRFDTAPIVPSSNPNGTSFDGLDPSCTLVP